MSQQTSTPVPPFRTKRSVREAMALGSRWARTRTIGEGQLVGTVVRASSTSRWLLWDGLEHSGPEWTSVGNTAGWEVHDGGFHVDGRTYTWLAPAPDEINEAKFARMALNPNRRSGPCDECGGEVAARAGHIRERWDSEAERRVWVALHPYGECVPASASVSAAA